MKTINVILVSLLVLSACTLSNQNNETSPMESYVLSDTSIVAHPVGYKFPERETFTVLSWNVEHFVDPFDDPYINNRREDNPSDQMETKVNLLMKALEKADADIVVLQEFESEKYLMALARDSFPELGYQFFSDAASPGWYMNVVLMSRLPLGVLQAYGDVYTPVTDYIDEEGKRETQVNLNTRLWTLQVFPSADYDFWLTGVHLKAGRGERNEAMRKGQILFLQSQFEQLLRLDQQANLMMAGDFNAYPMSEELKQLTDPELSLVQLIDVLDTGIYTHPADTPVRRLDYMIFNQNMANELLENAVQVMNFFSSDSMRMISDHLPVMGTFYNSDRP